MPEQQLYDDNGKPIGGGGVTYDDNGKPISVAPPSAPHTNGDYYWQAFKDFGEGLKTSAGKTLDALNQFAPSPVQPTRAQEAARLEAELKTAPPLNFDPRVSGRAIWKGVRNITAKDVGEGVGDIGQMYLAGKAAGAVEPETIRGVINTTGRGIDAVGRGSTAVGEATGKGSTGAAVLGAVTQHPVAATAAVVVPPILKFGGKGLSAIGRAMQSEVPEGANVRYQPSSGIPRELTPEEQVPSEGANVRYQASDETPRQLTPDEQGQAEVVGPQPRLVKGENPSVEDALMAALEEVRGQQSGAGTTPPDVTLTSAGKPSVTPERYGEMGETTPPAGTARGELPAPRPQQGVLKTAKPAAAEPEPAGNPHGELTEEELNMVRQIAAENDAIRYSGRNYNPTVGRGGDIEVSGGAGGAESLGLVKDYGGYGSRAKIVEEANNIIDGAGKSNANTRAIIEAARARVAGGGGSGTDLPPDAWKYHETPREFEARSAAGEASPAMKEAQAQQEADARPPYMRSALIEEVLKQAKEQGIEVDTEALQRGLNDPAELVSDLLNKYRQGGEDTDFNPAEIEGGAPTPATAATLAAPPEDVVLPGTEAARQVGKADVAFKAPQQASGEDFGLDARTAAQVAADEAAAAKQAEGPSMFDEAPEGPAEGPANPHRFESEQGWKKFVKGFAKGMTDEDIRAWFTKKGYDGVVIEGKQGDKVYGLDEVGKALPETPGVKAQTAEGKPDRSGKTAEEDRRNQIAARDLARELSRGGEKVTTEDVRNRNRERMTGKVGEKSVLPAPRVKAINAKLKEMLDRNATDQEFEDYLDAGQEHSKKQVGLLIQTAMENAGRKSIVALAGIAAGGLRQALVDQLQKKDEQ